MAGKKSFSGVLLAGLISFTNILQADVITIGTDKDNTLYENASGSLSNGAGIHFFVGRTASIGGGLIRRGIISFDIAGNIPVGSIINSVDLTLAMSRTNFSAPATDVDLHRVSNDWGEGTSDAAFQEGMGASSTTGDATWIHQFFNTDPWDNAGGDFSATVSGSTNVAGLAFYTWTSTSQMVTDVQDWLDNPVTNFGWLLSGDETTTTTAKRFDTKEHITTANRPALTIDYSLPAACCNESTGFCDDGISQIDCESLGRRFGSTCATIDPPCVQPANPPIPIELELVADGLTAPVYLTHAGDGSGRLFILDQVGQIRIVKDGVLLPTPYLDITDRMITPNAFFDERGLLGLAFHPNYATNGRFFIRYSKPRAGDPLEPCNDPEGFGVGCHEAILAEYNVGVDLTSDVADPGSEIILFRVDEPQFNHNSGQVAFGPDGLLYWTLGDGGGAHDGLAVDPPLHGPIGNGQNTQTALGSLLRIDVDSTPTNGPYVDEVVVEIGGPTGCASSTCCPGCNQSTGCFFNEAFRVLGAPEWPTTDPLPTGSPGEGGEFVFKFSHLVVLDGPGADLRFWQANAFGGVPEESIISVSEDGVSFSVLVPNLNDSVHTGQDPVTGFFFDFDISQTGLSAVRYVRVVDVLGNCDGSDIDAIEALNFYAIPAGNPFADGVDGLPEIYAYGLRNPYRFSFVDFTDGGNDFEIIVADVGQNLLEEIDFIPGLPAPGLLNYGWVIREGTICFDPLNPTTPLKSCATTGPFGEPLLDPVLEYDHSVGIAVIGGYVYRGSAYPPLSGKYVFADFSQDFIIPSGRLFYTDIDGPDAWILKEFFLAPEGNPLGKFMFGIGEDESGELYALASDNLGPTGNAGVVYRLVPPEPVLEKVGSRYIAAIVPPATSPMAIAFSRKCEVATELIYVGASSGPSNVALQVDLPVNAAFLTSLAWGQVVNIAGLDITSDSDYNVQIDYGIIGVPALSASEIVSTYFYCDSTGVEGGLPDGNVEVNDVLASVQAWLGDFVSVPLLRVDVISLSSPLCLVDQSMDINDVLECVNTWLGSPDPCAGSCPPP